MSDVSEDLLTLCAREMYQRDANANEVLSESELENYKYMGAACLELANEKQKDPIWSPDKLILYFIELILVLNLLTFFASRLLGLEVNVVATGGAVLICLGFSTIIRKLNKIANQE